MRLIDIYWMILIVKRIRTAFEVIRLKRTEARLNRHKQSEMDQIKAIRRLYFARNCNTIDYNDLDISYSCDLDNSE
jgi:hypothetical protein